MLLTTTRLLTATAALAALTTAQDHNQGGDASGSQTSDAAELLNVVSILQTALPSTLLNEALTNSAGVSAELASQFNAGETPAWFSSLPNGVKTYLVPTLTDLPTTASETGSMTTDHATTQHSTSSSKTSTETEKSASRTSEAGAGNAAATGAVVAGMAGFAGFVGVLAL
ncbi:hypothetical protein BST61_g4344 [Cercospora zeina]